MNTKLRTEAKNDFEKDFFKLLNNDFFRKTIDKKPLPIGKNKKVNGLFKGELEGKIIK